MNNKNESVLILAIVNEICRNEGGTAVKNIGPKRQCLEAPIQSYALAKGDFFFESIEDAKDEEKWKDAIENKDIVPFPDIEDIDDNSTDPEVIEGRFKDVTTKAPVAGSDYTLNLSVCTYEAAASYENSEYTQIFQITTKNELGCQVNDEGEVRGRNLKSFLVGNREEAQDDALPSVHINIKYGSRFFSFLQLPFEAIELEGIYNVSFTQESASATDVEFKTYESCAGSSISDLTSSDFKLYEEDGTEDTDATFSGPDGDGVFSVTSTGISDGWYIETDGVVTTTNNIYESGKLIIVLGN